MLEDVVSCSKGSVEWLEVSCDHDQSDLSSNSKEHEGISDALGNHRHFSGFAYEGVQNLANDHCIEVGTLRILGSFSCVADWQIGEG